MWYCTAGGDKITIYAADEEEATNSEHHEKEYEMQTQERENQKITSPDDV
jgi:hypothetical protein